MYSNYQLAGNTLLHVLHLTLPTDKSINKLEYTQYHQNFISIVYFY